MNDKHLLLDVRVRERYLKRGQLDAKELEKHLNELPDLADRCEPVSFPQPALDGDADDNSEDD